MAVSAAPTSTAIPLWSRVGTAGHVVSQLFLAPPDGHVAARLGDPAMRAAWPLDDDGSRRALASLDNGVDLDLARREYERLLRRSGSVCVLESGYAADPTETARRRAAARSAYDRSGLTVPSAHRAVPADHLGLELAFLARSATAVGGTADLLTASDRFRRAHVDFFAPRVLERLTASATTPLYAALPGLTWGFLSAHERLCAAGSGRTT